MNDREKTTPAPLDITFYSVGFCCLSVCAANDVSDSTVVVRANVEHPTGIASGWEVSEDKTFADKRYPNPCPCEDKPDTHRHLLLNC